MGKNNRKLIELKVDEEYICADGCGEIIPVKYDFVYLEIRDAKTNDLLIEKEFEDYKCPKCGGFVCIWNDANEELSARPATVELTMS